MKSGQDIIMGVYTRKSILYCIIHQNIWSANLSFCKLSVFPHSGIIKQASHKKPTWISHEQLNFQYIACLHRVGYGSSKKEMETTAEDEYKGWYLGWCDYSSSVGSSSTLAYSHKMKNGLIPPICVEVTFLIANIALWDDRLGGFKVGCDGCVG